MFNLLIVIVSLLLVTLLAIAAIYYGGKAFQDSGVKARRAQALNEGFQIKGAAAVHYTKEGSYSRTIPQLAEATYLKSTPNMAWGSFKDTAYVRDESLEWCEGLNRKLGVETMLSCSDPEVVGKTLCCVNE